MTKMTDFYSKHQKKIHTILFTFLFISIFFAIYATPLYDDDLVYMKQWKSDLLIQNISDIYHFQIAHYLNWGGRTIAHTILQLLLLCPKMISALLNTITLFLLGYLINKISLKKVSTLFFLFTLSLLYYLNPTFKESILWLTGSANYLYTTVLILIVIYPLSKIYLNEEIKLSYLYLPVFFLAGWCNENMSATLLLYIFCTILYARKRKKAPSWLYFSFFFALIGFGLLVLAPGNFVRASGLPSGFMSILYRGYGQISAWTNWLIIPLVILISLLYHTYKKENRLDDFNISLTIFAIISILAMFISPVYPQRATFGSFVVILIIILHNVEKLYNSYKKEITALMIIIIICSILSISSLGILSYAQNINPTIGR